jgi:rhodanese-related sulfurtransferase
MKKWFSNLKADLIMLWLAFTLSLCAGLFVNQWRDKPLPLLYQTKEERVMAAASRISALAETSTRTAEATMPDYMELDHFLAFIENKKGVILDARPAVFHRTGHVPGALCLPRDDFESGYARHKETLEAHKDSMIVIYCSNNSCEDSDLVRKALKQLGYGNLSVFKGGWADWVASGLPEEGNP